MLPVKEKEKYEFEITSVSSDGNGVGHVGSFAVFVPETVRGDFICAEIIKTKSRYAVGKLCNLLRPSEYRVVPECGIYSLCGGCQLMHMSYNEQLAVKEGIVKNALERIGGFNNFEFSKIEGMENPKRYRNKLIFPIGQDKNNNPICGFYAQKSHDVMPLSDCLNGDALNSRIIDTVLEYMKKNNVRAYDEKTGKGIMRKLFIRKSFSQNEIMVVISASSANLPKRDELINKIVLIDERIVSVILNIDTKRQNYALGDENITLYGKTFLTDSLLGIEFKISPHSFFQINPVMTEKLYGKALEYADINKNTAVMDIYCGIGTISLCAAKIAKKVIGVEIVEQAIRDAEENAQINKITNARFYPSSAEEIVPKLIDDGERPDVVILDPPRKGSDEETLSAIIKAAPSRIVYVSCNPSTLARDLKFLADGGYSLKKAQPFDLFPNTMHVETVALLSQRVK